MINELTFVDSFILVIEQAKDDLVNLKGISQTVSITTIIHAPPPPSPRLNTNLIAFLEIATHSSKSNVGTTFLVITVYPGGDAWESN